MIDGKRQWLIEELGRHTYVTKWEAEAELRVLITEAEWSDYLSSRVYYAEKN